MNQLRNVANKRKKTDIAESLVDDVTHLGDPPFDNVAEVFVVDIIVLLPDTPLSTLLQLILTISSFT